MPDDEETRAELWRTQQRNRHRFRRVLNRLLRGSREAAREVREDWEPITKKDDA